MAPHRPVILVLAAFAVLVLAFVGWRSLTEPGRQAEKAAEANAERLKAEAGAGAAQDAMGAAEKAADARSTITATTEANRAEILSSEGADAAVGDGVHGAGLRSLCRRASARDDPRCREMRGAGS
jgi:hypothetical protein